MCKRQLGELNEAADQFRDRDAELVFISPDTKEETEKFLDEINVRERHFTMLLDPDFRIIKRLKLFQENDVKGEAIPATFIIDKEGVLRFKFIPQHYSERPPVQYVLDMLDAIRRKN